jgi:hypothetical protein
LIFGGIADALLLLDQILDLEINPSTRDEYRPP